MMSSNKLFGFIRKKLKISPSHNSDEVVDNGLILGNVSVPPELIARILCYADEKTLLNCRRVCKCWNEIIVDYDVWRRKAVLKTGFQFPPTDALGWKDYYIICVKTGQNLIKNHSGAEGFKYWDIKHNGGNRWIVEYPPSGAPMLPREPDLKPKQHCFATSYSICSKRYTVDLVEEGFPIYMLDEMSPPIEVSLVFVQIIFRA